MRLDRPFIGGDLESAHVPTDCQIDADVQSANIGTHSAWRQVDDRLFRYNKKIRIRYAKMTL